MKNDKKSPLNDRLHDARVERGWPQQHLAELYCALDFSRKAQSFCQRALSIAVKILGPQHPETITYREHLSRIMHKIEEEQNDKYHPAPPSS